MITELAPSGITRLHSSIRQSGDTETMATRPTVAAQVVARVQRLGEPTCLG